MHEITYCTVTEESQCISNVMYNNVSSVSSDILVVWNVPQFVLPQF